MKSKEKQKMDTKSLKEKIKEAKERTRQWANNINVEWPGWEEDKRLSENKVK